MKCVVKLGGSLIKNAEILNCIRKIERWSSQIIIVPGGGQFADTVRSSQSQWQLNDSIAHYMSVLAMQQTALLIHGLSPSLPIMTSLEYLNKNVPIRIWSPQIMDLESAGLPHSWDLTADSIAAWLASFWRADRLILVKSAPIDPLASIYELQQEGILDAAFHQYIDAEKFKITIINHAQLEHAYDSIT